MFLLGFGEISVGPADWSHLPARMRDHDPLPNNLTCSIIQCTPSHSHFQLSIALNVHQTAMARYKSEPGPCSKYLTHRPPRTSSPTLKGRCRCISHTSHSPYHTASCHGIQSHYHRRNTQTRGEETCCRQFCRTRYSSEVVSSSPGSISPDRVDLVTSLLMWRHELRRCNATMRRKPYLSGKMWQHLHLYPAGRGL